MHKSKLQSLAEWSTNYVEQKNLKYYWEADGFKFNNRHLACWYEKEYNVWTPLVCTELDRYRHYLSDGIVDMDYNYNADYLRQLRNDYDHLQLLISGGYDSVTVFLEAVENNVFIDECISICVERLSQMQNEELVYNVHPLLLEHKDAFGKYTMLTTTFEMLEKAWEDPYTFFTQTTGHVMPQWVGYLFTSLYAREHPENGCYIKGNDKPQLVSYNNRWYVAALDACVYKELDIPNYLSFWLEPENIKSMIQDARSYRDYIKENYIIKDTVQFFKVRDRDEENAAINRRDIPYPEKQLRNTGIIDEKAERVFHSLVKHDQVELMSNYFRCMQTYWEVFPESKQHPEKTMKNGKFAWFIDIDSLEVYNQTDLIPNGFV